MSRMNERDFLTLARRLAREATEADWRTAIGRAYFAAFHVARNLLEGMGFDVPHADRAHGHLWLRLSNCGDAQIQSAGGRLNVLRSDRNRADYDLWRFIRQNEADKCIDLAELIILALDLAAQEPLRWRIRDEMIRYERDVLCDVTWRP